MTEDEKAWVSELLSASSDAKKKQQVLERLAETLEMTYILNLPADREILTALDRFSKTGGNAKLKTQAKRLIKTYQI